ELEDASHSNLSMVVEAAGPVDPALLERALYRLALHHDALRLRFTQGADGWAQTGTRDAAVPVETVDLAQVAEGERARVRDEAKARAERGLDLASGPMLRAVLLRGDGPDRVLLATHHLVVDVVSWRVLLEDLETAYGQMRRGEPVKLPPKTTSFRAWATLLERHAASDALRAEAAWWLALAAHAGEEEIPADCPGGANTAADRETFVVALDADETRALLQEVPAVHRTQVNDALLSALARALAPWTGREAVWVELEGHGREELFEGVDLSRTAGWFTTLFPVRLPVGAADGPVAALAAVRDALRAVPTRGIGYGVLRWMSPDAELRASLAALPRPRVSFNYLGRFDADGAGGDGFFSFAPEGPGPDRAPGNARPHLLDVNAWVSGGQLQVGWTFSRAVHDRAGVERLADAYLAALGALVAASRGERVEAALPTPADFPLAGLDQARLDALLAAYGGAGAVEDVYPLTPLQEGLLFHARYAPDSEAYVEQTAVTLRGPLDAEAWVRAWQAVVDRHPALRTAFAAEAGGAPLQVVPRRAEVPVLRADWSELSADERAAQVAELEAGERRRGFDPARAPLMRLALARTGADEYRSVLTFHHLLLDGWSLPRVWAEAGALYEAFRTGSEADLPAPRPFREHVAWLARQDQGAAEAFWRGALDGVAPATLPGARRAERGGQPAAFGETWRTMDADEAAAVQALARRSGLTLNTVFAGAWGLLLSRYTGADDVAFGSVVSGRPAELPGVEEMVGMFINTIPVRVQVPQDERVLPWLRALQAWQTDARAHEHAPLAQVQRWSGIPADTPLFESLYAFENFPMEAGAAGAADDGLVAEDFVTTERVAYPLVLTVLPGATPMLRLSYDAERFDDEAAGRILAHLRALLAAIAATPDAPLAALPMLDADERAALVAAGSARVSFSVTRALPALFAAQAKRRPHARALTFGGESVTYAELDARANRLAHRLIALGARADALVGLFVDRSIETVVGILAILKAGAAYLPLDPAYPEDRVAYMLEDSGVSIVVTTAALRGHLPAGTTILSLQCDADAVAAESADAPAIDISPDSLAYVIYTSGSTGRPKGVQVTHANVARLFSATNVWFGFGTKDVWTLFHSYAFDFSVWEIWGALLYGGRLVVVPFDVSRSPEEFYALLERERVTVLNQTPSAFRQLMRADEEAAGRGEMRELALRYVVFGGEALEPATLRGWVERRGDDRPRLVNMYGITETTVHVTYRPIRAADTVDGSSSPIGIPIPDLAVHLFDRNGQLVPTGVVGEMYVGGAGVARGYLGRPELTAQRFVPDPFSADPHARLYRSGDLARRLADGSLEFQGRADEQVKVRGFRIEPGEIESVLLAHPHVREAVVMARGEGEQRRLVAWVVAHGVDAAALRAHLLGHLPDYMVPAAWALLDALPLTRNGKVDRRALPEPAADAGAGEAQAPETPTQELLAGVWREVLGIERAGPADDFFTLGGHSLLAMRVVTRARAVFGAELPVRAVFEAPTLREMAARIDALRAGDAAATAPPLEPAPRDAPLPLSYGQERLWLMETLSPGALAYGVTVPLAFEADADASVLALALAEVVRRHEALRTVFRAVEHGTAVQQVQPPYAVDVAVDDLAAAPADVQERAVADAAQLASGQRFDLENGPLLRARLLRLQGMSVLLVNVHHIAFDGWSARVLERELRALYDAFSRGEPSPLAPLPVQYADFAAWQRRWLESGVLDGQVEFWRRALAGAPAALDLPADRPRPAARTYEGGRRWFHLPNEVADAARELARREGATLFMVLLAAFDVLMARLSGTSDVVVGTQVAGRTREEIEGLVGIFVNGLALRTDLGGDPSFTEAVARVRRATLDAYAHQDVPFQRLVDALGVERTLSHPPVYNVSFILQTD
ncbi:MAG TPA: amino acid adenylation domain-containing protein, partial [Longimicrobium sp.]